MSDGSFLVNYPNPKRRLRISVLWNSDSQNHKWGNWKPTIPNDGSLVGRDERQKGDQLPDEERYLEGVNSHQFPNRRWLVPIPA